MHPVLLSLGAFQLKSIGIFYLLAFLATGFIIWRRSKEENYEETVIFDGFLLSLLWGLIASRVAFIVMHFNQFSYHLDKWLDFINFPGFEMLFFVLMMGIVFYRFALKNKWDGFELMDFWVTAISLGSVFVQLGYFLAGIKIGQETSLPWGVIFTGTFEKRHPSQLYFAVFYLLLFIVLSKLEYVYRTFEWYRAKKNSAQSGFLTSIFFIANGLVLLPISFLRVPSFTINNFPLDWLIFLASFVFGLGLLLNRAGRTIIPQKRKKTWIKKPK